MMRLGVDQRDDRPLPIMENCVAVHDRFQTRKLSADCHYLSLFDRQQHGKFSSLSN